MITDEQIDKIAHAAVGTCDTPSALIDRFELDCDESTLEDRLLDRNIETCQCCGWWFNSHDLIEAIPNGDFVCDQCATDEDE